MTSNGMFGQFLFRFVLLVSGFGLGSTRIWQTMHLDEEDNCQSYTSNDDMAEGDVYVVRSDSWGGQDTPHRRPAECTAKFNFGVRLVAIRLVEWSCEQPDRDMYLDVYEDCEGTTGQLVKRFNCSSQAPESVLVESPCVTLYHYRGKKRIGYFFTIEVTASKEIIAFPVGGIAAIVIAIIVLILLVFKVVCVVSGCEETFPDEDMTDSDHRRLVDSSTDTIYENQIFESRSPQRRPGRPGGSTWIRRDTQVKIGNGKPSVTFADEVPRTYGATDERECHLSITSSL